MMKKQHQSAILGGLLCLILVLLLSCMWAVRATYAEELKTESAGTENYATWLQTIYSREEGLSVGKANAIAMTSDGILWIGTYAGLYRYNGSKFTRMSQFDSVKSVECLYVDDCDRLWVGTNDRGISIFENEQLIQVLTAEDGLASDAVRSIVQSSEGDYYIGTSGSMTVLHRQEERYEADTIPNIEYADRSTADSKGHVTAVSSYGTMYLLKDSAEVQELKLTDANEQFTSCVFDTNGCLHAGTALGDIYTYEITEAGLREVNHIECEGIRKINSLIRANEETIFVCADNGIGYLDGENEFHFLETPNFTSNIYDVILDYQGNLWFSSTRMGLLRLCKTGFVEMFTEYSITPTVVNSIERYEGALFAGTDSGLVILNETDRKSVHNELTEFFKGIRIRQIVRDERNHLWFCTYGDGLVEYDGTELHSVDEKGEYLGKRVRTALVLKNGDLAVSSDTGIVCLRDGEVIESLTEEDGIDNQINLCMLEKEDGTLLIGSDGSGLYVKTEEGIHHIGTAEGLPSGVILRMVEDTEGDGIFLVTSNSLCYMEADETIRELDHFPYSNNYDILQQEDTVFVLSSAGIYAVLREELLSNSESMNYTYLDNRAGLHDSLVANSWILHEKDTQKVYLATSAGITLFDLEEYEKRPSEFLIRVTSITVDDEDYSISADETFSFSRKVRRLEIRPEIVNYTTVDPLISCLLEGFDKEPIVMPQSELSTIVYTNLPAGRYTFSMSLVDSESGVKISGKVYYLEKEQAFADTVWFPVMIAAGVILIASWIGLYVAERTYRRNMTAKQRELAETWKISITDELTGLKNRMAMRIELEKLLNHQVTLTMMDIDDFKFFNDTYGHEMGDHILEAVGKVISKYYPKSEGAFRYGGDEFLLCDPDLSEEMLKKKWLQIEKDLQELTIPGCRETIRISHGSVTGVPKNSEDLKKLWNEADERLYKNKRNKH